MRPRRAGGTVMITASARTETRSDSTSTAPSPCTMRCTGEPRITRPSSSLARRTEISCAPPTNLYSSAEASISNSPSKLPEEAMSAKTPSRETSADEPVLFGGGLDFEQPLETAGGGDVRQDAQQRDVAGLAGVKRLHREIEVEPGAPALCVLELPRLERLSVRLRGLLRLPGRVGRHVPRELSQGPKSVLDLAERGGVCEGDLTVLLVLRATIAFAEHGTPEKVRREGLDAEITGDRADATLPRPDPLSTHLDCCSRNAPSHRPTTDPVLGFDHHHRSARGVQLSCRHEPGQPSADDHDVDRRILARGASAHPPASVPPIFLSLTVGLQ